MTFLLNDFALWQINLDKAFNRGVYKKCNPCWTEAHSDRVKASEPWLMVAKNVSGMP